MILQIHVDRKDIKADRDCYGKYDKNHKFCLNICCVRYECEKIKRD